ncbi:MAG: CAP domain-containing protein, partial [Acidimicrobiales bacterium]
MRRTLMAVLFGLVASLMPLGMQDASAATDPVSAEAQFVARINSLRTSKGLAPLELHGELVGLARRWAVSMAAADRISHHPNLVGSVSAPWVKLGENVGVGTDVDRLFDAFVASPSHYKNLVDPAFRQIGVGVVLGRDGAIFTAHEFMVMGAVPAQAPAPTAALIPGPQVAPPAPPAPPA